MNHRLYEDWLMAYLEPTEDALDGQQVAAVRAHLQECTACNQLADSWREVDARLRKSPVLVPQPGFTARWQARLEADRRRLQRRQSLATLAFGVTAAVLVLGSLVVLLWPWLRAPDLLVWAGMYRAFTLFSIADALQDFLSALVRTVSGVVPIGWWVFSAGMLCELGVLWVVSYRMLTNPRRIAQ